LNPAALLSLLLNVMLPLALLVAAGGLWARYAGGLSADTLRITLGQLVVRLFLPALFFSVTATTAIDTRLLVVPLVLGLSTLTGGTLLYLLFYRSLCGRALPDNVRAALLLTGMFGNVLFMGLPLLSHIFGPAGERYPVFADVLAITPLVWTLGVWIATRLGGQDPDTRPRFWATVLRMPPVWAFVAGVTANQLNLPVEHLAHAARLIGQPTIPLMIFVLGLAIPWQDLRPTRAIMLTVAFKLLVMPLIALAWVHGLGRGTEEAEIAAIVEAAVPTLVASILLADMFNLDVRTTALVLGWSTALSLLSLPVWLYLLLQ
jgi:predicted permease